MCELFAMSSAVPATVTYSLEQFAKHGGLTAGNKDGWGICYYEEEDIRLIKEPTPAASSPWVKFIAEQELASDCVVAHVRMASRGRTHLENTHPFERELAGRRHVFAHNGTLAEVHEKWPLRDQRFQPIGETDSEHAFCVLLERLHDLWYGATRPPALADRQEVIAQFAADMRPLGQINFLYTDGDILWVHGHKRHHTIDGVVSAEATPPGLHLLRQTREPVGEKLECDGLKVATGQPGIVLFASVPLNDEDWQPIPEGTLIAIRNGHEVARVGQGG
ncbi:MAG: class II glutamine amidotransferase [Pseudomonadota bacterium]